MNNKHPYIYHGAQTMVLKYLWWKGERFISLSTISRIINGETRPSIRQARLIAGALRNACSIEIDHMDMFTKYVKGEPIDRFVKSVSGEAVNVR